ncbi:hypothetical protein CALCODRAFT_489165 [Calocera cornea HHB12733]|uniref:Replication factor-A protein 1 N-terminal domain-containing protein n=1 Tax=Calocera cornea HHB12733 TaxID=1353952 RepID=A0A166JG42_9BASI|nr:hypothetical protein CALCODRAFT_489165 [Calocera cornea HHB12733]
MSVILKKGTCADLLENVQPLTSANVQVIHIEEASEKTASWKQYIVHISDGFQSIPATLSLRLNKLVSSKKLGLHTVLKIEAYVRVELCTLRVVILRDVTIVGVADGVAGNPVYCDVSVEPQNAISKALEYLEQTSTSKIGVGPRGLTAASSLASANVRKTDGALTHGSFATDPLIKRIAPIGQMDRLPEMTCVGE